MSELIQYKCPACGGAISFDSETQTMKCPFCDSELDVAALQAKDEVLNDTDSAEMEWETTPSSEWGEDETNGMRVYVCNSCGGQVIGDETLAATKCPYCDNNVVVVGQFKGDLRPNYIIPFKLSKEDAVAGFKRHLEGKKLLPKVFKEQSHIEEVKGLYVPVWLFDADVDADIRYSATKTNFWSDSNYRYTATSHYSLTRSGNIGFQYVPADGSSKFDDNIMESIEPYDFSGAVDFQTAYLAGYIADRYDVTSEECIARANDRIKNSTVEAFRDTVKGYGSVTTSSSSIKLLNGQCKYALYPVWVLNTKWQDKVYIFAMNGQTGKFVGDLPCDKGAYWRYFAIIAAVCAAIVLLIAYLFFLF